MRSVDTFFAGHRRETIIDGAAILCTAAGEKRTKLTMKLPLVGDQLIGMPSWVSEPFSDISKPEYAVKSIASTMELDPMILRVFELPEDETRPDKEAITFDGVRMCSFKIERDGDSEKEHPDIVLSFTAYLPRTGKMLKFADDNYNTSLFIRYEAAQGTLLDENPNHQPSDAATGQPAAKNGVVEDEYEAERREATSKAHDVEFGERASSIVSTNFSGTKKKDIIKPKAPKVLPGQKRDGFGKPLNAVQ